MAIHSGLACAEMIDRSMISNPGAIGVCGWTPKLGFPGTCSLMKKNEKDEKMQPWEKAGAGKTSA